MAVATLVPTSTSRKVPRNSANAVRPTFSPTVEP
jgi:hypothetical protein